MKEVLLALLLAAGVQLAASQSWAVEPVPALQPGRELLQDASAGGYYGGSEATGRRRLMQADTTEGAGGYYGGRRRVLEAGTEGLAEEEVAQSAAAAAAQQSASTVAADVSELPQGSCYCRYDSDYNAWALAETVCRDALYAKCKANPRLSCTWLDGYYSSGVRATPGFVLPHEADISSFLFEDCEPNPPCACTGMKFDGSDDAATSVRCCQDLRAACRRPFAGVDCATVTKYCSGDEPSATLLHWTQHALWHSKCDDYPGRPYEFLALSEATEPQAQVEVPQQAEAASPMLLSTMEQAVPSIAPHMLLILAGGLVAAALAGTVAGVRRALSSAACEEEEAAALSQPLVSDKSGGLPRRGSSNGLLPSCTPSRWPSQASLHE